MRRNDDNPLSAAITRMEQTPDSGIWVPDTRATGFAEECARQAAIADAANRADPELGQLEEAVAEDIAEHIDALEAGQGE